MPYSDYTSREEIIKKRGYSPKIHGDMFSLYISSYPCEVEYLAHRLGNIHKKFVELCCGVGINLTGLALSFKQGVGVDIDASVLKNCDQNIKDLKLQKKLKTILGDITDVSLLQALNADIAIYDVPFWETYKSDQNSTLAKNNPSLKSTVTNIQKYITKDIVIFCSKDITFDYILSELGIDFEYQKVYVNNKHDRNIIYLGGLLHKVGKSLLYLSTPNAK